MASRLLRHIICGIFLMVLPVHAAEKCLYDNINGLKGTALLEALHQDIRTHHVLSYDSAWAYKNNVYVLNGLYIIDMYSDCSNVAASLKHCTSVSGDFCDCYNREHALPKSWWGHKDASPEPMYTDIVHVLPVDGATNSLRSYYPYGEVADKNMTWSNSVGARLGTSSAYGSSDYVFCPNPAYRGDIARIYFYMITCYRDKNFTCNAQARRVMNYNNGVASFKTAFLNMLLQWHREDPVSDMERKCNDRVKKKQGNRNPFVDDPELVEYIWGNKQSEVYHCSGTALPTIPCTTTPYTKILKDGHLYVIINGHTYNLQGQPTNF